MRIAVVTSSYPCAAGDPTGHFVAAEVRALASAGYSVSVLCPLPSTLQIPGVSYQRVGGGSLFGWPGALERLKERPQRALFTLPFVRDVRRQLRALAPLDLVIAHFVVPCAWPAAITADAPLDVVVHGNDGRTLLSLPKTLRRYVLGRLAARCRSIRVSSEELRMALLRELPPNHPPVARFMPPLSMDGAPTREEARRTLALGDEPVIVVVGRLIASKRIEVALEAGRLAGGHLVVIGDGPLERQLRERFVDVRFLGRLTHPETLIWIAAADLMLSASRQEGAPTAIREARAMGVPVVACPVGDLPDWATLDHGLMLTR